MIFSLILAFLIAVVAVIFALGNTQEVTVSFLTWSVDGSLALVLLIAVAIGVLIGVLIMTPSVVKQKLAISGQRKRLKSTEEERDEQKTKLAEIEEKEKEKVLAEKLKVEEAAKAEAKRKEDEMAKSLAEARELAESTDKTN